MGYHVKSNLTRTEMVNDLREGLEGSIGDGQNTASFRWLDRRPEGPGAVPVGKSFHYSGFIYPDMERDWIPSTSDGLERIPCSVSSTTLALMDSIDGRVVGLPGRWVWLVGGGGLLEVVGGLDVGLVVVGG